jgi:AAA+ superfamily predicted ATPase
MLRLLEYFSGILILTTNRVKSIDYAIMSRISYAIKFKTLSTEHQKVVFGNYLAQAKKKKNVEASENEKLKAMIKSFKSNRSLNGREIRTMFTTAQLLGEGKLTAENMEEIREQQQSFKDDMNTMYILAEKEAVVQ